jgi:arylsulfatase A
MMKNPSALYDLATDPGEENNVIAKHPEVAQRLEKEAADLVVNGRTTTGSVQKNDTGYWKDLKWISEAEYKKHQKR